MEYNKIIEVIATAIDPLAFSKDIHEAHQHCSPLRVEVVRDRARENAADALEALQGEMLRTRLDLTPEEVREKTGDELRAITGESLWQQLKNLKREE